MAGRRPTVILNRLPVLHGSVLGLQLLVLTLTFDHYSIPNVQVIGPVDVMQLFILAAVATVLPPIIDTVISRFQLWSFHATTIYHYPAAATDSSPETRLILVWHITGRCREPYSSASM